MGKYLAITIQILLSLHFLFANEPQEFAFLNEIRKFDISTILTAQEIEIGDNSQVIPRPEPIGFLGENFHRFFIHFISVVKNHDNPYQYFVFGKTKFKDNINTFIGTINISNAATFKKPDIPGNTQGYVAADYNFFEDSKQYGSGKFQGTCILSFVIDSNGNFKYNGSSIVADGFCNAQFEGIWISYKTGKTKKCNWGDFRIPDCGDLDVGAAEFGINDKYEMNGWQNYRSPWEEDGKEEHRKKWWQD